MKKYLVSLIILFFFTQNLLAKTTFNQQKELINSQVIRDNLECNRLVSILGGLNSIDLLWLGNLKDKEYQSALITIDAITSNKIYYICENIKNKSITSDNSLEVLSQRNLTKIFYNSKDLFTYVFSMTSKKSRDYIMSTLNLNRYNINYNDLNQAYVSGLMLINDNKEKKKPKKITKKNDNEKQKVIKKIKKLTSGDYYLFGHSTSGEKFWGSTEAISQKVQVGKAFSSNGKTCYIRSEQKKSSAPYKGIFFLKCPNDRIDGSWTQKTGSSPGLGQGFTDDGEVITAFFSPKQSTIINFASKYFDKPTIKIAEVSEPKQKEIKQSISKDKTPPKIIIAKNLTFKNSSYKLEGKVEDKGSKNIYVEIDGVIQNAKNGKFIFERFSPIDETVKIVAIDQWGNRSKEKVVNIKINTQSTIVAKKLEKLNPNKVKFNQLSKDKVAIVIGIERYDRTPQATYANLDAKYFYEYARLSFGIPKENIKLLVDKDANLIQSLGVLKKWLPGKINKSRTDLLIFFAGHGLASNDGKELYLLPQDSDPDLLSRTALSRSELFKTILDLKPNKVTMFFDTCYSGISRDEKTLLASARPVRLASSEQDIIPDNFTIFSASKLDQISSGLKEANHGIFSYYLMKGLEGNADLNEDKKITNGELRSYLDKNVSQKAAELGRQQNPSLSGDPNQVLVSYR